MGRTENERKWRQLASEKLLEEINPYLAGKPKVWVKRFGMEVSQTETLGEIFKTRIPLGQGRFRIDRRVFHELPLTAGHLYVVQNYSGGTPLPQDFLYVIDELNIPRACALLPGKGFGFDVWKSELNIDKNGVDEFCIYLDGIKEEGFLGGPVLAKYSEYDVQLAPKLSIKVPWTVQINVLDDHKILIMYKTKLIRNLWNGKPESCLVKELFNLVEKIKEAVDGFNYQGPAPKPAILIPTMSFLAIPQLADKITDKGMDDVL